MAKNFKQEGKKINTGTASGLTAGEPFVLGNHQPCVLLTDAETASPYKATVATVGVFVLPVEAESGAIAQYSPVFYDATDKQLNDDAGNNKFFGIALEAVGNGETEEIDVLLFGRPFVPASITATELANNAVTTAKILNANVTLAKLAADATKFLMGAITDPGDGVAIPVTGSGVCAMTTAGAETRTLAIPTFVGQMLVLTLDVRVGNCVVTVASSVDGTNNTLTFDAAGETIILIGTQIAGVRCWRILENIGAVGLSAT